jgi:RimJ/RimL family protein N-acetyltransferase
VVIEADGLVLREWTERDLPQMVALFDTPEMNRWTPLAHPFDLAAAADYVRRAQAGRLAGSLQLAITESGDQPLGEILLFPAGNPGTCEFAYAVGAEHRGRSLAVRALTALLPLAVSRGYSTATLKIDVGNRPSQRVAISAGFTISRRPLEKRERKDCTLSLQTWSRSIGAGGRF